MSKIALLAVDISAVEGWRSASGLDESAAVWVRSAPDVDRNWPIVSILCLQGWDASNVNRVLRSHIERRIAAAATAGTDTREAREEEPLDAPTPAPEEFDSAVGSRQVLGVSNQQERMMREFGVSAAMIGMLSDVGRNHLCMLINEGREIDARRYVQHLGRDYGIASPFAGPTRYSNDELIRTIESFVGESHRAEFQRMSRPRLEECARAARLALAARSIELGGNMDDVIDGHMDQIVTILSISNEEYATGFIEESAPHVERVEAMAAAQLAAEGAARRRRAVRIDPLADHLRDYMRSAAREDAERRSRRARPRDADF